MDPEKIRYRLHELRCKALTKGALQPLDGENSFNYITRCEQAKIVAFAEAYEIRTGNRFYYYADTDRWLSDPEHTVIQRERNALKERRW